MAIKDSYPAIRPSLDLNFAGSRMVDPRITFTRASSATYFDDKGVMRTAPAGVPRIDHDPVTGECKGLLIEEQRTNLLTYSEQFNTANWDKLGATATADTIVAPDGTLSADKVIEDTANSEHYFRSKGIPCGAGTYTSSVFWHESSDRSLYLRVVHNGEAYDTSQVVFSKDSLSLSQVSGNATSASATNVGGGWWRIALVFSILATRNVQHGVQLWRTTAFYTGNGTSGIYIWGAQLEVGAFPTSYIKTEASQVTRAADNAVMTSTNFSDWYRQDEGTLFAESSTLALSATDKRIFSVNTGSTQNNMGLHFGTISGGVHAGVIATDGIFQYGPVEGAYVGNTYYKRALAYINSNPQVATSGFLGSTAGASTTIVPSGLNSLEIGSRVAAQQLNGHIRRIAYYPRRLANEQLQALTA